MDMLNTSSLKSAVVPDRLVRSFWHGRFSPYEALCLSSFVAAGIRVELFGDDHVTGLPDGVTYRNARDILDRDVAFYSHETDGRSPALHANHFRYALLETLGGWWVDTDVLLAANALPAGDIFLARQSEEEINNAVMRFPAGHPLMTAARQRAASLQNANWGDTGPKLLTELQPLLAPGMLIAPRASAYAIGADEFEKFFLPGAREEIEERTFDSSFVHLWHEMWRKAGIPKTIAPPKGSWLDRMFDRYQVPVTWSDRLDAEYIARWAALRRERDHAGHHNLLYDRELSRLRAQTGPPEIGAPDASLLERLNVLEARLSAVEAGHNRVQKAYARSRANLRRLWLRPPMWTFEQHSPRKLDLIGLPAAPSLPARIPAIAIVTPSYNHARFLRATIDSVTQQNYPRLFYHVQDGGSNDETVAILKDYGERISWKSQPDDGQADAINRGFAGVDCEIMGYLNSDDTLLPGTLASVANFFLAHPGVDILYGHRVFIDCDGLEIGRAILPAHDDKALHYAGYIPQETMFWRRRVWDALGAIDTDFEYALDWDFQLRAQAAGFKLARMRRFLACFRVHDEQKTSKNYDVGREEMQVLRTRYLGQAPSQREIYRAMFPYLARQFLFHCCYRIGLVKQ
jgi:GT2 family glycosyltransferase